jgi:hypothetical protein
MDRGKVLSGVVENIYAADGGWGELWVSGRGVVLLC